MQRSHKIKMIPNKAQRVALSKAAGCARYAYNYALATWKEQYALFKEGKAEKPDVYKISRMWTIHKPEWAYESPSCSQSRAIMNLGKAYMGFWNKRTEAPSFKKKGVRDVLYLANDKFKSSGKRAKLPKIGSVKLTEELRFQGKIMSATVSKCADDWFISIQVELPEREPSPNKSIVGVDVGIKDIAVASDGTKLINPKLLKEHESKLAEAHQKLSRTQKGSARQSTIKLKLQKIHQKITNVRQDAIHKFTTKLSKNHGTAVIETLEVQEMKEKAVKWMRALLQDTTMSEVHRQLGYKMKVHKAPKYYPSSKMCSKCGHIVDSLSLSERTYRCNVCDFICDRDLNASFNLRNMRWITP